MLTDKSQQSAHVQGSTPVASTIGEELLVIGNVTSKGEIHVDGRVQGGIHCHSLVLGENSQIEDSVVAQNVVIRGNLSGSVRALRVTLQSTSHVEGDILHQSLAMEQGAHFEGKSRRSNDPLSLSQTVPVDRAATKPLVVTEQPEPRKDKPGGTFKRSLAELD